MKKQTVPTMRHDRVIQDVSTGLYFTKTKDGRSLPTAPHARLSCYTMEEAEAIVSQFKGKCHVREATLSEHIRWNAVKAGSVTSELKKRKVRINARKGGRPRVRGKRWRHYYHDKTLNRLANTVWKGRRLVEKEMLAILARSLDEADFIVKVNAQPIKRHHDRRTKAGVGSVDQIAA